MKSITLAFSVASLLTLTACASSAPGSRLCEAAGIENSCGIPADACLEALNRDETFRLENDFTAWSVSLGDGDTDPGSPRCILRAHDTGATGFPAFNPDPREIEIDVGKAVAPGRLLQSEEPEFDGDDQQAIADAA